MASWSTSISEYVCYSCSSWVVVLSILCQVDRVKVLAEGKNAVGKLLVELQVLKSTADGAGARKFYHKLTQPISGWEGEVRDIVLRKKLVCLLRISPV